MQGAGIKKLYRKVGNKSADYVAMENPRVRRDGSYIIERFHPTSGTDIKVYAVRLTAGGGQRLVGSKALATDPNVQVVPRQTYTGLRSPHLE